MKKVLMKFLFPHRGNSYHPHLLRTFGIASLFVTILGVFALAVGGHIVLERTHFTAAVLPAVLVDEANADRAGQYGQLTINPLLVEAAQLKANDMAAKGYFAHKTPEGYSPWYWLDKVGYDFDYAGENLAVNFSDSADVNTAWMNSPSHRENIMNGNFTEIGIATANGVYEGKPTTFVVQFFGTPAAPLVKTVSDTQQSEPAVAVKNTTPPAPLKTTARSVTTTASSTVLGASESELYVAVVKAAATGTSAASVATTSTRYAGSLEKLALSPGKVLSWVYTILALLIIIALISMIFVEIHRKHPMYIILGIALLLLMFSLLYMYQSVLFGTIIVR